MAEEEVPNLSPLCEKRKKIVIRLILHYTKFQKVMGIKWIIIKEVYIPPSFHL
jgi:hypothetical protein